jgi:DNA replication protein DnaC
MTSLSEIVSTFTEGWANTAKKDEFRSKIIYTDFLLIDDVDKVYMPQSENNIVLSVTDETLRKRIHNNRCVLMTTNEGPKELVRIFGQSVGSLLSEGLVPINFVGTDHRKVNPARAKWESIT